MARPRLPSLNARIRLKRTPLDLTGKQHQAAPSRSERVEVPDEPVPSAVEVGPPEILRVPVLADGADPGKIAPSPLAIRDRLLVDRRLVADHAPERLFAYDVTLATMKHLRGVACPGDRIVFRRGGRAAPDRVCAVRTPEGIVLARVLFKGRSLLLLPGEGERVKALPGVIAGTHVLLLRR